MAGAGGVMVVDALQLLAANALFLAAGLGVVRLCLGPGTIRRRLGLAFVAGVAAVGVAAQLLLLAGASLSIPQVVLLCAALFAAGFLRRGEAAGAAETGEGGRTLALLPAALAAAALILLAVDLWFQPLAVWDAWSQWTPKARSFVLLDGLDAGLFAAPPYVFWNPDYPILLPALEAIDFRFAGFNTQILHLQFGLLLAGFVLALAELARGRVPALVLWPVVAATVWAPSLLIQTASAYADVPLAVFFALAGVCAARWLQEGDCGFLALFGLLSAAALATKTEGVILVGSLVVVAALLALLTSRRHALLTLGAGAAALAVGLVPWRLWTLAHDVEGVYSSSLLAERITDPGFLGGSAERVPLGVARLAREALDPTSWLLLVPLAVAAIALALRYAPRRESPLLVLGTSLAALLGLVVAYWLTPFPFEWHLDRSASRVVTGPLLFAAALTPFLLAEALVPRRPG
jgi:hypothetical protein